MPDTNALVHLRDIKISKREACLWLWDEFEVKLGKDIAKEVREFAARNSKLTPTNISKRLDNSVAALKERLEKMEKCFLGPLGISFVSNDNLGERTNCQLALQLIVGNTTRSVIFLTDELRITRPTGFVHKTFLSYRVGIVWNSLDFVLYLYFRHPRFTFAEAEVVIRDLNTRIKGNAEEMAARLTRYTQNLKAIDSARKQLPNLWRRPNREG